jgi:hypothetical protein
MDPWGLFTDVSDVVVAGELGPVLAQHGTTELALLAMPAQLHASALEAQADSFDAGEDRANGQHSRSFPGKALARFSLASHVPLS